MQVKSIRQNEYRRCARVPEISTQIYAFLCTNRRFFLASAAQLGVIYDNCSDKKYHELGSLCPRLVKGPIHEYAFSFSRKP
jgi:hypothetical protein